MNGFVGQPELPYVDAVNGMDLEGIVIPWDSENPVDVNF
jgi:hypothetical protein